MYRSFHCLLLTLFACLLSISGSAQTLAYEADFTTVESGSDEYVLMKDDNSGYPDWLFSNCYAAPKGYILVGSSSGIGSFTTAELGLHGNASVILEIKRGGTGSANSLFTASITGNGSLRKSEFIVTDKSNYCGFALYIKDGQPNTRITISTKEAGKTLMVKSVKAYNVGDAIFYESFNNSNGHSGNDGVFVPSGKAFITGDYDNPGTTSNAVLKEDRCAYLGSKSSSYYTTPAMNVSVIDNRAVLSFRMAGTKDYVFTENLTVSCTGDEMLNPASFTAEKEKWNTYYSVVDKITESTKFKFTTSFSFLDDVKVSAIPANLDEAKDNMIYVTAYAGQTADVQLIRKLTEKVWCPLCLPFDVTKEALETATGTTCELRTLTDVTDGVFIFDKAETIAAGTPFLVKVPTTVINPIFTGVTIQNVAAKTLDYGTYKFVGTYSPVDLETNGTNLFLDVDGNLVKPTSVNRMNGLRAYFVVPLKSQARIAFSSDETIVVDKPIRRAINVKEDIYNLSGRKTSSTHRRGVRILKAKKYYAN